MPPDAATPDGSFTRLDGRDVYRITDVDRLPPFLMSIVSDSDHWMFVSSRGGLTAGRVDEDHALFPYVTDDQLHLCAGLTGPLTLLRVHAPDGVRLWEPLTDRVKAPGRRRHLYKDLLGHSVTLEEEAPDLGLTFRYRWAASEPLGFVRTAVLARDPGAPPVRVEVLDGLVNLLPAGVDWHTQHRFSCLINAYTRCDLDAATGLALVGMTSRLTDKAEPAEALRATAAWSVGLPGATVALRADAAEAFRGGRPVEASPVLTGRRAAYLVSATLNLDAGEARTWHVGADVHLDHPAAERLRARLGDAAAVARLAEESVAQTGARLRALVASADGLQHTGDRAASAHHYANVLFNIMRGGVFADGYAVPGADFAAFVAQRA